MTRFGFSKVGEISLLQDRLVFDLTNPGDNCGLVYLWVEVSGVTSTVVYVGKAGGTLQERCKQHGSGFRHSAPGRAHSDRLRRGIGENKRYEIYARKSDTNQILGESGISMACVEELALIQKFKPAWNASKSSVWRALTENDA